MSHGRGHALGGRHDGGGARPVEPGRGRVAPVRRASAASGPNTMRWTIAGGRVKRSTSAYSYATAASQSGLGRPFSFVRPVFARPKMTSISSTKRAAIGPLPGVASISTRTWAFPSPAFHQSCATPAETVTVVPGPAVRRAPSRETPSSPSMTVKRSSRWSWTCSPTTAAPGSSHMVATARRPSVSSGWTSARTSSLVLTFRIQSPVAMCRSFPGGLPGDHRGNPRRPPEPEEAPGARPPRVSRRMDVIDELVAHNQAYADGLEPRHLDVRPRRRLAIVTCMDSRLDVFAALGLAERRGARAAERGRRHHRRRHPLARRLPAAARHRAGHARPPHRLRHADADRRRLPRRAAGGDRAWRRRSRSSRSPTSTPTSASRSCACAARSSCCTGRRCGASSTTSTRTGCARSRCRRRREPGDGDPRARRTRRARPRRRAAGLRGPELGRRDNPDADANIEALLTAWTARRRSARARPPRLGRAGLAARAGRAGQRAEALRARRAGPPRRQRRSTAPSSGRPTCTRGSARPGSARVVIAGITTNHCCETTARFAGNLGYRTLFALDATHTFDRAAPDGADRARRGARAHHRGQPRRRVRRGRHDRRARRRRRRARA